MVSAKMTLPFFVKIRIYVHGSLNVFNHRTNVDVNNRFVCYDMEQELQHYLDTYESTHNYDEYHFDLDDIEHDPYVLISILSALHEGEFTLDEVQGTLQMLFEKQYILTEEVIVETRYRTETDTWTDADGNTHTETHRVPYDNYIEKTQAVHGWLSTYERLVNSQNFFSPYLTQEDLSCLGRTNFLSNAVIVCRIDD